MTNTKPGLWQAFLLDESGWVAESAADLLEEHGPECTVTIGIYRDSALPVKQTGDDELSRTPTSRFTEDVAAEWELDLVDDDGETDHIADKVKQAQAMAAGLNIAAANQGEYNRGTDLSAALHTMADRLAVYTGPLPSGGYEWSHLDFRFGGVSPKTYPSDAVSAVDQLATALAGHPGAEKLTPYGKEYEAKEVFGSLRLRVYADLPKDDPAALQAEIESLRAQLAAKDGAQ
ncbi:hypothetical protein [Actinoplanes sp. NPDC048796]|uniref:hypothetical protein n=1 Tax=Actinoplanes sp. NPDC048796 TaxID=3155640 RepID=UPI0033E719CD